MTIRWHWFTLLALGIGLLQMATGPLLAFPLPGTQGEFLFLLAFYAALSARTSHALPAFWIAGIMRDLFLGQRLGGSLLLYCIAACILNEWRGYGIRWHWLAETGLLGALLLGILWLRPLVELQDTSTLFRPEHLLACLSSALYTVLLAPCFGIVLSDLPIRLWRKNAPGYGLPGTP